MSKSKVYSSIGNREAERLTEGEGLLRAGQALCSDFYRIRAAFWFKICQRGWFISILGVHNAGWFTCLLGVGLGGPTSRPTGVPQCQQHPVVMIGTWTLCCIFFSLLFRENPETCSISVNRLTSRVVYKFKSVD